MDKDTMFTLPDYHKARLKHQEGPVDPDLIEIKPQPTPSSSPQIRIFLKEDDERKEEEKPEKLRKDKDCCIIT